MSGDGQVKMLKALLSQARRERDEARADRDRLRLEVTKLNDLLWRTKPALLAHVRQEDTASGRPRP